MSAARKVTMVTRSPRRTVRRASVTPGEPTPTLPVIVTRESAIVYLMWTGTSVNSARREHGTSLKVRTFSIVFKLIYWWIYWWILLFFLKVRSTDC